jgi:uncharacterized protein YggE
MRTLFAAAAAALILPSAAQAQNAAVPREDVPRVSVSGIGESRATPDRALVTVGVQSRAATAAAAAAENARKQRAILDTLRALGFTSEQLTTANYSVRPEMQHDPRGQQEPRVTGYVVSNMVRVDARRVEQAGQVIDAALARGANQVHGLSFYLADPAPARQLALRNAVERARADAEVLASAAGGTLGQILSLSTSPQSGPVRFEQDLRMRALGGEAAMATAVEPGEETVRAVVHIEWAFVAR